MAGVAVTNLLSNTERAFADPFSKSFDEIYAREHLPGELLSVANATTNSNVAQQKVKSVIATRNMPQQAQLQTVETLIEVSSVVDSIVNNSVARTGGKPSIAVVLCVHSNSKQKLVLEKDKNLETMSITKLLLPSLQRTIEPENFNYTLFIGMDTTDIFWNNPAVQTELRNQAGPSLPIEFRSIPPNISRIPFNEMLKVAYDMGSEYMIRINDDSEFITGNWSSLAVHKLASLDPPNVGVVGPTCKEGNTYILTHDFVHRTHMDIFKGVYYSKVFGNWWIDDWITWTYVPRRMRKLDNWVVKHHVNHHGTRYRVDGTKQRLVGSEVRKGRGAVAKWLVDHNYTKEAQSLSAQFDVLLIIDESTFEFFLNWWTYYIRLPDNGLSNVYIVVEEQNLYKKLTQPSALEKLRKHRAVVDFSPRTRTPTVDNKSKIRTQPQRMLEYLGKGRNIVYSDVHILWTSDPFDSLPTAPSAVDAYIKVDNATFEDHTPYYDGDFMIMYASTFMLMFLAEWQLRLTKIKVPKETPVLNDLIKGMRLLGVNKRITPQALPFDKFPSGKAYFGEFSQAQRDNVTVVHNNYLADLDAKKQRLVKHGLWEPFAL
jgi:hypothetical protein